MKLVPLLRFWGGKGAEEEPEFPDELPEEVLQLPPEEQPTDSAETDAENEEEEEKDEEEGEQEKEEEEGEMEPAGGDAGMLKVFQEVEEEYVDNSALVSDLDDVPASELLEELHALAAAFGVRSRGDEVDPSSTA